MNEKDSFSMMPKDKLVLVWMVSNYYEGFALAKLVKNENGEYTLYENEDGKAYGNVELISHWWHLPYYKKPHNCRCKDSSLRCVTNSEGGLNLVFEFNSIKDNSRSSIIKQVNYCPICGKYKDE